MATVAGCKNVKTITPSDTVELSPAALGLYVGVTGDVKVTDIDGNVATFVNVPAGTLLSGFQISLVWATGTTATNIVAHS